MCYSFILAMCKFVNSMCKVKTESNFWGALAVYTSLATTVRLTLFFSGGRLANGSEGWVH